MNELIFGRTVKIQYECRDIGHGVESGEATGQFTSEIDAWGKHTFHPDGGKAPLYLFDDEILSCVASPNSIQHPKVLVN